MYLKNLLLRGYRRSESKILLGLKLFTMIMLILCLTGYTAIVIMDVQQDAPAIQTSFIYPDTIRVPSKHKNIF